MRAGFSQPLCLVSVVVGAGFSRPLSLVHCALRDRWLSHSGHFGLERLVLRERLLVEHARPVIEEALGVAIPAVRLHDLRAVHHEHVAAVLLDDVAVLRPLVAEGTIEAADTIYGVSMGDDGASKVLSLRMEELVED